MRHQARAVVIGFAALLLISTPCSLASAKALIIHATGPSSAKFPVGSVLKEPVEIVLVKGDRLTVLDAIGTRVLVGPLRLTKDEVRRPSEVRVAALRKLFEDRPRSRAAGSRSTSEGTAAEAESTRRTTSRARNLWEVGTSSKGDWCATDPEGIEIAREPVSAKGKLLLTAPSGTTHEVVWPKGERLVYWPAEARIAEGSTYQLRYEQEDPAFVTFHLIKTDGQDLLKLGQELLRFSCHTQLDLLFGDGPWGS